jgi:nucleolar MIF4G domain-containing protein 1
MQTDPSKAVDFISLPGPTIVFLMTFLTALFIATQTTSPLFALPKSYKRSSFNAEPIEELFDKTLSNIDLAQGWLWVIEREMGKKGQHVLEELGSLEGEVVKRGLEIATRIVSRATYH